MLKALGSFIGGVGFPIAVATYLLLRFEQVLRENTEALHALRRLVAALLRTE